MTGVKNKLAALECPSTLRPQVLCKSVHWLNSAEGTSKHKHLMSISAASFSPLYDGQLVKESLGVFLISNFRRVLNLVCIFLGISPASDCCMPTFRNTLSVPSS